jgi:putative DNA primase/helicase
LDEVVAIIQRHVVARRGALVTLALWVTLTYLTDVVSVLPRLLLTSPTKACGKTRLLTVLGDLVRRPLPASSISAAALFRIIETGKPTLLLDEMDNARLEEASDLKAVLNSGHIRGCAYTLRCVGDHHEVRCFSTWAPIALAAIGRLPDTVASRCVSVRMERPRAGQTVEPLREYRLKADLEPVRRRLARWCRDKAEPIRTLEPARPPSLSDRAADNWTPLFAIAEMAGGDWPERARREAASEPRGGGDALGDEEVLLADLRQMFDEKATDRLASTEIVAALAELENRPWGEWRQGRALTPRGLADILRGFGIEPRNIRMSSGRTPKGYLREQFEDAFARYLPDPVVLNRHSATTRTNIGRKSVTDAPHTPGHVETENAGRPAIDAGCGGVAGNIQFDLLSHFGWEPPTDCELRFPYD